MSQTQKTKIACPHCSKTVRVSVPLEADAVRIEGSLQVNIADLLPIRCPHCQQYIQVKVSDMSLLYEAVALNTF